MNTASRLQQGLLTCLLVTFLSLSGVESIAADALNYTAPHYRVTPQRAAKMNLDDYRRAGIERSAEHAVEVVPNTRIQRYVSARDGNDANQGSRSQPWKSLQHAAANIGPDTTVWVDASGEYQGRVKLRQSGEADGWIVFRALNPAQAPLLRGNQRDGALVHIDASYVAFSGFELAYHDRPGLDRDEIGIDIRPRNGDIKYIRVIGNHLHHIGPGQIEQERCDYNAHAIIARARKGHAIDELVIAGNRIHDIYAGRSEVLVVNGRVRRFRISSNFIYDVNNIAIDVIGYEHGNSDTASDGLVVDNIILDASNYWPYCTRGNCGYAPNDESSNGIYVDGGANLLIEYNIVGRTDHGIELQSENNELIRNVRVSNNYVFNSNYRNFTLGDHEGSSASHNLFENRHELQNEALQRCR